MFSYLLAFNMAAYFQPMVEHRLSKMDFAISYNPSYRRWFIHTAQKKNSAEAYQMMCLLIGSIDLAVIHDEISNDKMQCLNRLKLRQLSFHACKFIGNDANAMLGQQIDSICFDDPRNTTMKYLLQLAEQCKAKKICINNLGIESGVDLKLSHAHEVALLLLKKSTNKLEGDLDIRITLPHLTAVEIGPCESVRVRVTRE